MYYLQKHSDVKTVVEAVHELSRRRTDNDFNGLPGDRSPGSQRPTQREERVFNKAGYDVCPLSL